MTPEQIPDIVFGIINDEYETSKNMKSDSKINIELNAFLNSKFGKKFINETVIYYFSDFDDYEHGERWLYNKRHLVVIEHNLHYRRYIKTDNKEVYDKKHEKLTDSKKNKEKNSIIMDR